MRAIKTAVRLIPVLALLVAGCGSSAREEVSDYKFHGYACTDDCSGHEAGYEWAEEQGITNPDDCEGDSDSFIEGCEAYAEEHGDFDPYEGVDSPDQRF